MEMMRKWTKRLIIFAGFMLAVNIAIYIGVIGFINITDMVMWILNLTGVL